jgi:hypothetical protein
MQRTYYVALLFRGRTAVFQFSRTLDGLDCEIAEYRGPRATTIRAARERLRHLKAAVLDDLRRSYPRRNLRSVRIESAGVRAR